MYTAYSILLLMALILYFPVYFFRSRILKREKIYLRNRLALDLKPRAAERKGLWIHAVSVGEALSLQNLIHELKTKHPEWDICFSTLTATGLDVAQEKFREADAVFLVPLDFRSSLGRALKAIHPRLLILAESEFWPNLLREAKKKGIPVLLINGRISQKSFAAYRKLRPLARGLFRNVSLFLMQTEQDSEKLKGLGVDADRVQIAGNLKSEVRLPVFTKDDLAAFRASLGMTGREKVVVAGSLRKGEGEILLKAFSAARKIRTDLRFILAPRHIEKSGESEKAAQTLGFRTVRRTKLDPAIPWDVLILDTLGELAQFYALSDAAFVGGSLVDWGGHNLLEPAYYGKPIFFGPYMQNFAFLAESFIRVGAARIVRTEQDLTEMFLLKDEEGLERMGSIASEHLASLGGATDRAIRAIERFMAGP